MAVVGCTGAEGVEKSWFSELTVGGLVGKAGREFWAVRFGSAYWGMAAAWGISGWACEGAGWADASIKLIGEGSVAERRLRQEFSASECEGIGASAWVANGKFVSMN